MPWASRLRLLADLSVDDQHEPDRPDAEREQKNVEQRTERSRAQVAPGQLKEIHAGGRHGPARQRQLPRNLRLQAGVVRGDDQRYRVLLRGVQQQIGDGGTGLVVEIRRRLIREQELRTIHQCAGNRDALLLADRELMRIGIDALVDAERLPASTWAAARSTAQPGDALRNQQVLHRGQRGQQMELLQHDADVAAAEAVARAAARAPTDPARRRRPNRRWARSRPAIRCRSVVLPQPEGPTTRMLLSGSSTNSSSRNTSSPSS